MIPLSEDNIRITQTIKPPSYLSKIQNKQQHLEHPNQNMAELSRAIFHHVPTGETNISTALPYELNGNEYGLYWLGVSTEYTVVLNTYFQHFPCTATIDTERLLILLQTVYGEVLEGEFPSYAFGFKVSGFWMVDGEMGLMEKWCRSM